MEQQTEGNYSTSFSDKRRKAFLLDTTDILGHTHTHTRFLKELANSTRKCEDKWHEVRGFVSGNASNMAKMCFNLRQKDDHLIACGCRAKLTNFLAQDFNVPVVRQSEVFLLVSKKHKKACCQIHISKKD